MPCSTGGKHSGSGNVPLKIFDYLAAGRPIVATDTPAHRVALDEDRAVLVSPAVEAIADAIARLLEDSEGAGRFGAAAKKYADEYLGLKAFSDLVTRLYEQVELPESDPDG